jgi:hypothetical protein
MARNRASSEPAGKQREQNHSIGLIGSKSVDGVDGGYLELPALLPLHKSLTDGK